MPGARDGQLRVRRGTDSPPWALQMFDTDLGLWLTLCQAAEEDEMVRAGIPILRGPYVVDFSDIPHDGDTMTLWTPQVGDVLLRLFPDEQTAIQWDHGTLYIGPNVDPIADTGVLAFAPAGGIGTGPHDAPRLDNVGDAIYGAATDVGGAALTATAWLFHSTDPVQVQLGDTPGTDPTQGHVELYALVARAVAP